MQACYMPVVQRTLLLQVALGQRVGSLTDQLQQSIQNIASYLGSYMLRCCQVFQAKTAGTAAVARQRKVCLCALHLALVAAA